MATDITIPARMRILVAEDNREMRNAIIRLVESEYEVVGSVSDGRALTKAAAELQPDIGVFDISMPVMNGIEAALEIKRQGSKMKIVFLTVNEDTDFVTAALAAGALGYVIKRQMASDLLKALGEACEGRSFVSSWRPLDPVKE